MLANPRGFCAGVERAIEIVERLLARHGSPIYVKHEIVHNRHIIADLTARGVKFIEDPATLPAGAILVYSAHGVARAVRRAATTAGLRVYDATCPLVTKVHAQVGRMRRAGLEIIMIGHAGHPEVEGTLGQVASGITLVQTLADARSVPVATPQKLAYVTQTTLSVDETRAIIAVLKDRFPAIVSPSKEDICFATQNRQDAVKKLAPNCSLLIVVGSVNSSNSKRLRELAGRCGARAELVDDAQQIDPSWLDQVDRIGVTAGASAPAYVVDEIIAHLRALSPEAEICESAGVTEDVVFTVPKTLLLAPAR